MTYCRSRVLSAPGILEAAGLPEEEVAGWQSVELSRSFEADWRATGEFLTAGAALLARLPARPARDERESAAAQAIGSALTSARERFLAIHAEAVYDELTRSGPLRDEALVQAAAERFPRLTPDRA